MKKTNICIFFLPALFLLASCMTFSTIPRISEFEKKIELRENSSITFENLQGNLEIYGWKKDSVEIRAEKTGTDSQLRQTDIEVKKREDSLKIKTLFPRADIRRVFVDYELRVPRNIRLKKINISKGNLKSFQIYGEFNASLEEGNIEVEDFSGSCNLFTDKGTIAVRIFEIRNNDDFTFKTNDGDITLYLPAELNARIEAKTRLGKINSDFAADEKTSKEWVKTFEEGKAKITVESWSGKILIKKI